MEEKSPYPMKAEIIETNDLTKANQLCQEGYFLLATRINKFIVDDNEFEEEFIYSLGKPIEE